MTPEQARDEIVQMLGEGYTVSVEHTAWSHKCGTLRSLYSVYILRDGVDWWESELASPDACIAAVREKYADHIAARQNPPLPEKPPEGYYFLRENGKPVCRVPNGKEWFVTVAANVTTPTAATGEPCDYYSGRRWILAPERRKAERRRGNE